MHEPSHTEKDPLTKVAGGKICKANNAQAYL